MWTRLKECIAKADQVIAMRGDIQAKPAHRIEK
jgi:hypothetical protein